MEWGYEQNCYDGCTFNKMVDGNQITIQFHVDDLKISHVKQSVVDSIHSIRFLRVQKAFIF